MPRPTRKKIKFDEDSVNDLLQEIYNDSHNLKAKISRLFIKWERLAKDEALIAGIGDQIVKLIIAESKNQDQKIMLLKYLKEVVFDRDKKTEKEDKDEAVTPERRQDLIRMVEAELIKKK